MSSAHALAHELCPKACTLQHLHCLLFLFPKHLIISISYFLLLPLLTGQKVQHHARAHIFVARAEREAYEYSSKRKQRGPLTLSLFAICFSSSSRLHPPPTFSSHLTSIQNTGSETVSTIKLKNEAQQEQREFRETVADPLHNLPPKQTERLAHRRVDTDQRTNPRISDSRPSLPSLFILAYSLTTYQATRTRTPPPPHTHTHTGLLDTLSAICIVR